MLTTRMLLQIITQYEGDCTKCKHKISNMKILFINKVKLDNIEEEKKPGFYSSPYPTPPLNHKRDNVQVTGQIQRTTFNNNIGRRSDQISQIINIIEQIKFKLFCKPFEERHTA